MTLRLIQTRTDDGSRRVVAVRPDSGDAHVMEGVDSVYELAHRALATGRGLEATASDLARGEAVERQSLAEAGWLLPPVDHPDPAHLLVSGTGLTHVGSAEGRDKMHRQAEEGPVTDSMKMFRLGLEGGRPRAGEMGVQPEWFYKGDGSIVVPPGGDLPLPAFARDGGEEPEIVGLYLIDSEGRPRRLGYALGNEFSDHVTERENYLYLAHSKLRACAFGPELLVGELAANVSGYSRILRDGATLWERPFASGEANMSHSLANLEAHHFKYPAFRRPGDVHVHFFGTGTLSFSDGISTRPGDVFEVSAEAFGLPLRNRLVADERAAPAVEPL